MGKPLVRVRIRFPDVILFASRWYTWINAGKSFTKSIENSVYRCPQFINSSRECWGCRAYLPCWFNQVWSHAARPEKLPCFLLYTRDYEPLVASLNRYTAGAPWRFYLTINSHLHPLKLFARESPIFPYDYHCKRFNIRTWEVVSSSWFHIARGSSVLSWFSSWEAHYPRGSLGSCGVRVPSSD